MYHILYTISGKFIAVDKEFPSFAAVEEWLRSIGAVYWQIGLPDKEKPLDLHDVIG